MKYLFIGDIHGDLKLVKFLLKNFSQYILCFIGDILDGIHDTYSDIECLKLILKSDSILLRGNHEEGYLYTSQRCTGFNPITYLLFQEVKDEYLNKSKYFLYIKEHNVLVTHAGLTKTLWDEFNFNTNNLEQILNEWSLNPNMSPIHWIGSCRGGYSKTGGILWCDYNYEFKPVSCIKQVFGHTSWLKDKDSNGIRRIDDNYNIDCLLRQYSLLEFDLKSGVFSEITIPYNYV